MKIEMGQDQQQQQQQQQELQQSESSEDSCILYNCCRGGMVEAAELVLHNSSPIMVTAGGSDGRIRFWDWKTFASLGSLRIHPGQRGPAPVTPRCYYSPVVLTFFCHERSSLISFCRDGHIHEWKVEEEAKKMIITANNNNNTKKSSNESHEHHTYGTRRRRCRPHRFS